MAIQVETLAQTKEFEISALLREEFLCVRLQGRYTREMMTILQRQVFNKKDTGISIDASALSGMTMALARGLQQAQHDLHAGGHSLVLISPPDALRNFIKLLSADLKIPMLLSEAQLPAKSADLEAAAEKLREELEHVREELESNTLWRFQDREYCWVCPFCAEVCESIKVGGRAKIGPQMVERTWRHLNYECSTYTPMRPQYKTREQLEDKVKQLNEEKYAISKDRAEHLTTQVTDLTKKAKWAETVQKGVKIAATRQRKLLPMKAPKVKTCEISFTYRPAEELSGDFFDFVEMEGGRLAIVIGDVSGHGIEAGILMGMTKKVIEIRLAEFGDPVKAMKHTNSDILKDLDKASFVTAAAIVWDPEKRTITQARAGHSPPLLVSADPESSCRKLDPPGLVLGMAKDKVFESLTEPGVEEIKPGDVLLLYTDGLEEGKGEEDGKEFGVNRIIAILEAERSRPPAYILGAVFHEFDRYVGNSRPQDDDLTAICVRFK